MFDTAFPAALLGVAMFVVRLAKLCSDGAGGLCCSLICSASRPCLLTLFCPLSAPFRPPVYEGPSPLGQPMQESPLSHNQGPREFLGVAVLLLLFLRHVGAFSPSPSGTASTEPTLTSSCSAWPRTRRARFDSIPTRDRAEGGMTRDTAPFKA